MNIDKIVIKYIVGEELSVEEQKYLRDRQIKYELIRYLYVEKMKAEGIDLIGFHFTPDDSFMDTPIIDILNALLDFNEKVKNGEYTELCFRDHYPPVTNKEKFDLRNL